MVDASWRGENPSASSSYPSMGEGNHATTRFSESFSWLPNISTRQDCGEQTRTVHGGDGDVHGVFALEMMAMKVSGNVQTYCPNKLHTRPSVDVLISVLESVLC
jgi:hypothetical protein